MTTFPLKILYGWYRDLITNPKYRWWMIGGTLLYLLNPLDILPDMVPIVGQLDDAMLITLVATEISSVIKDRNALLKAQQTVQPTVSFTTKMTDVEMAAEMASGETVEVKAIEVV